MLTLFSSESLRSLILFSLLWPFYIVAASLRWCPSVAPTTHVHGFARSPSSPTRGWAAPGVSSRRRGCWLGAWRGQARQRRPLHSGDPWAPSNQSRRSVAVLHQCHLGIAAHVASASADTKLRFPGSCLKIRDLSIVFLLYLNRQLNAAHEAHCKWCRMNEGMNEGTGRWFHATTHTLTRRFT